MKIIQNFQNIEKNVKVLFKNKYDNTEKNYLIGKTDEQCYTGCARKKQPLCSQA